MLFFSFLVLLYHSSSTGVFAQSRRRRRRGFRDNVYAFHHHLGILLSRLYGQTDAARLIVNSSAIRRKRKKGKKRKRSRATRRTPSSYRHVIHKNVDRLFISVDYSKSIKESDSFIACCLLHLAQRDSRSLANGHRGRPYLSISIFYKNKCDQHETRDLFFFCVEEEMVWNQEMKKKRGRMVVADRETCRMVLFLINKDEARAWVIYPVMFLLLTGRA